MPKLIDVDSDRCIYQDADLKYIIRPKDGHRFEGVSFRVEIAESVSLHFNGAKTKYAKSDFDSYIFTADAGRELYSLNFKATVPGSDQKLYYDWHAGENGLSQLLPEM